ncbi:zinc-ribbon domain-containing protein [Eisenbergiella tayi]
MKCPRCGNELKDGMLFCEHCGSKSGLFRILNRKWR